MQLLALGISHHTAPLDVRERVAIVPERQEAQLRALLRQPDVSEASLWSTCNRTELVVALEQPESSSAVDWFRSSCAGLRQPIDPYLAIFRGPLAARHMFRLAGGLDSLVVGHAIGHFSWAMLLYAILSLTLIRMLPVFFSLAGLKVSTEGKLFMGWFGPRGLASIVFAVIVVNANVPNSGPIATTVVCTIMLSIIAHGVSANSWARGFGERSREH
jgi:hypothetical protein